MNKLIPIIMIIICVIAGAIVCYLLKVKNNQTKIQMSQLQLTANEFVNVKNIKDHFLYTRDVKL